MMLPLLKNFNGKTFALSANFLSRKEAKQEASRLRNNNFETRITRGRRSGFGDNKVIHKVWRRDKSSILTLLQ